MRILILGADGMLGHALVEAWADRHDVFASVRGGPARYTSFKDRFDPRRTIFDVDVQRPGDVLEAFGASRPDAVVNAVGIVKQRPDAKEILPSLEVNALFPHELARLCRATGAKLVHLSTDCVFSGERGRYREDDRADPTDLYGRTKLLGEVDAQGVLTLRTSIIGLAFRKTGLVEWFLAQRGTVKGYRRAIYTGLTTQEMARAIEHFLTHDRELCGLWHLASAPVSKFDLLSRLRERLHFTDVEIVPDDEFACDRSLDGSALEKQSTYRAPPWDAMLDQLAEQIQKRGRTS